MSRHTDAVLHDPEFKSAIQSTESLRSISKRFEVSFGFAQKARTKGLVAESDAAQTEAVADAVVATSRTESSDGAVIIEKKADRIIPLSEWLDDLRRDGLDPADYNTTHSHSVYLQHTRAGITKTLYANKFSATRKTAKEKLEQGAVDFSAAAKFIEDFVYVPAKRDFLVDAAVLQPTDEQWGKTDFAGGTSEASERVMHSYAAFADYVDEYRPREILIARTGDAIENVNNTSSQRDTNDLDLPAMIAHSFKMDLAGLKIIAPRAQRIVNAYVPSNHGRWRTGLKDEAGNPHADFGIAVARQIQHTQELLGVFPNVETVIPDALMESMAVRVGDATIGLVHGHQAGNPDKIGDWWSKQGHGRMPTWDADILLVGHFHSLRIQQSGNARWIFVGPASDNGSSWFTNLKGEQSRSGMLAFTLEGKQWRNQEIL